MCKEDTVMFMENFRNKNIEADIVDTKDDTSLSQEVEDNK